MSPRELVAAVRPGVLLHLRAGPADEVVLAGGGELFRVPLTPAAAARAAVAVAALPRLARLVPVPVPRPRWAGVLQDRATPFTAEARLPGVPLAYRPGLQGTDGRHGLHGLHGVALGQLAGLVMALRAVPQREAREWGVAGAGVLRHGALGGDALLVDPDSGLLTGVVGWDLRLCPDGPELLPPLDSDPALAALLAVTAGPLAAHLPRQ